ncbi:PREDICTED: uncharacterized protein LOC108750859 [Trachymyrmex septentrionalis]|uniref:uncharacterized protein LOC108750859 n=1 Tax=Trachymyrmex septentrionalis TaxID=34720 RepID=UPI00084F6C00|nr:PREDICTED: uncharacterized protein LOC108750859 [Trachymyrmex septentrionalis]
MYRLSFFPSNLISIHPSSFTSHRSSSLTTVRNGWFLNLSSVSIPIDIQCFLQLGENFALPLNDKRKIIFDCIKSVETGVHRMPIENRIAITNHSIPILNGIISSPITTSPIDKLLLRMESKTRAFLSEHNNVLFTHADKGNVTVALDREVYLEKMITLLNDKNTYCLINKDPIRKITTAIRSMLTRWKTKKYISETKYKTLYCSDGSLPRAYGVPKIHKPCCPLRVIVSSLGSPLYPLATFLHNILIKSIPKAKSHIKNSFELVEKLKRLHTTDQYKLISLDVKSLFTNVPVDIAIDCINEHWTYVAGDCPLPREEFVGAIRFILDSTFFSFNNNFYKQSYGTPMGSPLSPVIADLTGRKLKTRIAEHRNHIKHNTSARSVITEHRRQLDHEFKWDEVEILDEEPSYRRRLVSEMINIRKQKNGINLQTDTDGLHKAVHKDPLLRDKKSNVVYKISCKSCDVSYVGQMCRQLKSRITEHKNHIRWNISIRNVITKHRLQKGYDFDWYNVIILDEEFHYKKRLISEKIFRKQTRRLNLQTDMERLSKAYLPIIDKL